MGKQISYMALIGALNYASLPYTVGVYIGYVYMTDSVCVWASFKALAQPHTIQHQGYCKTFDPSCLTIT